MTLEETKNFLHLVGLNFPNCMKHIKTKEDSDLLARQWQANFAYVSPVDMSLALNSYLSSGIDVATPSLGKLLGDLKTVLVSSLKIEYLEFEDIWDQILANCKCDSRKASENYRRLPKGVQDILGSPSVLVDIAYSSRDNLRWIHKDLSSRYDRMKQEETVQLKLGQTSKKEIESKYRLESDCTEIESKEALHKLDFNQLLDGARQ